MRRERKDTARLYVAHTHTALAVVQLHIRRGVYHSDSFIGRCLAIPDTRWVRTEPTPSPYAMEKNTSTPQPHIGHLIRQEVERQGLTVVALARMLSCSRTNIYKIFEHRSIDTAQLLRISSLLQTDFFRFYSETL